ncbi:hypothetical protein Acr_21g0008080 [Actinidia rufa]|uniref:Uncharacterized protein n=1 Tax=Actinidia rufa TaxID=165716 RepID=A0A7J0GHC1_9ERIC|nr:hypothetical protein Acr_21g0008080 [Actinidia rufa]
MPGRFGSLRMFLVLVINSLFFTSEARVLKHHTSPDQASETVFDRSDIESVETSCEKVYITHARFLKELEQSGPSPGGEGH